MKYTHSSANVDPTTKLIRVEYTYVHTISCIILKHFPYAKGKGLQQIKTTFQYVCISLLYLCVLSSDPICGVCVYINMCGCVDGINSSAEASPCGW